MTTHHDHHDGVQEGAALNFRLWPIGDIWHRKSHVGYLG